MNGRRVRPDQIAARAEACGSFQRRSMILLIVLFIITMLALVATTFTFRMQSDLAAVQARQYQAQAEAAARSGIDRVIYVLRTQRTDTDKWYTNREAFRRVLVWAPDKIGGSESIADQETVPGRPAWRYSVVAYQNTGTGAVDGSNTNVKMRYGVTDEASKVNLTTASRAQLLMLFDQLKLTDVTSEELTDALIDWRDKDDTPISIHGAESPFYMTLNPPYRAKNRPLETVEELLMVKGFNGRILFGEDYNRNGYLEPNEDDGPDGTFPPDNGDGKLDRGLLQYVTIYSWDWNLSNDNKRRIDLTTTNFDKIDKLPDYIQQEISPEILKFIADAKKRNYRFRSVAELVGLKVYEDGRSNYDNAWRQYVRDIARASRVRAQDRVDPESADEGTASDEGDSADEHGNTGTGGNGQNGPTGSDGANKQNGNGTSGANDANKNGNKNGNSSNSSDQNNKGGQNSNGQNNNSGNNNNGNNQNGGSNQDLQDDQNQNGSNNNANPGDGKSRRRSNTRNISFRPIVFRTVQNVGRARTRSGSQSNNGSNGAGSGGSQQQGNQDNGTGSQSRRGSRRGQTGNNSDDQNKDGQNQAGDGKASQNGSGNNTGGQNGNGNSNNNNSSGQNGGQRGSGNTPGSNPSNGGSGTSSQPEGRGTPIESPVTAADLPVLLDRLTATPVPAVAGLINVNTASAVVLKTIPGLTDEMVEQITAKRASLDSASRSTPAWLVTSGAVDPTTFALISNQVTTRSIQFTIDSIGFADHVGTFKRIEAVVEMRGQVSQIKYYRDVSSLGIGFPVHDDQRSEGLAASN